LDTFCAYPDVEHAGVILIGPLGRVLAVNPEARAILSEHDGLAIDQERLATPNGPCMQDGLFRVERPSGREPYVLWVTPLHNGSSLPSYRAVTIYSAAESKPLDLPLLRETFKLTRAELALAEQVMLGRQPQEAAAALGVTIHSVRTYLKRLYNKLGVRTQAKLVRKLLQTVQSFPDSPK
jgi:DNA-binding CsgD family transcriptional regulator